MIEVFATKEGTRSYFEKFAHLQRKECPWFYASPIGIGTHLGNMTDADSELYRQSIRYCLENGVNFIDTALNYRGMKSERDVGVALSELLDKKVVRRDEVVVSTKAGIIPGDIDAKLVPKDYLQRILIDGGIILESDVNVVETHRHVLEPEYYRFAIEKSRSHFKLDTIDIYYIHNPEVSMMVIGPGLFYKKLLKLFTFMEQQVEKGRIKFYGLATWQAFLYDPTEPGFISLEKVVHVAEAAGGANHHMRFIQFPFNDHQNEGAVKKNQFVQREWRTLLDAADRLGIYVTTSAPFSLGKLLRGEVSAEDALKKVIKTKGIFSSMTGMRHAHHAKANIDTIRLHEQ